MLLQDYALRVLNVALGPPRLGNQTAPDPNGQYSTSDYLRWMPSTGTAARQYTFVANFLQTTDLPGPNHSKCGHKVQGLQWHDVVAMALDLNSKHPELPENPERKTS